MHRFLSDQSTAIVELHSLCDGMFDDLSWIDRCCAVAPGAMDQASRALLDHTKHMTAVLSGHYGQSVSLGVRKHIEDGESYRRSIVLTVDGGARIVEVGVVRINLSFVSEAVRQDILARNEPLGEILARRAVLTRVEPDWFVRIPCETPIAAAFRSEKACDVYGRIGRIHCDHRQVIELLEVVSP